MRRASWALLAVCFIIGILDEILGLPAWLKSVSPFEHTPPLPPSLIAMTRFAQLIRAPQQPDEEKT